jgi:hypothetical protein
MLVTLRFDANRLPIYPYIGRRFDVFWISCEYYYLLFLFLVFRLKRHLFTHSNIISISRGRA